MAEIDTSIYGQIRAPKVRDPFEIAQNALALENARQANQMNALKFDELRRAQSDALADQEALRAYYQSGGGEGNLNALNVRPRLRAAEEKRLIDLAKERAEADSKRATTGKTTQETLDARLKTYRAALDFIDTPQAAARWTEAQHNDPIVGEFVRRNGSLDEAISRIPTDPQQFAQWRQQSAMGMQKFIDNKTALRGQDITVRGQDLTDARTRSEGAANREVTIRGQDMVDTRERDRLAAAQGENMPTTAEDRAALSQRLGVPVATRDPFTGMSPKGRETFQRDLYKQADKKLTEADDSVFAATSMARDAQRFLQLQGQTRAQGPALGRLPAMSDAAQEMDAITAKITPQMRQPGSGATSDFDAKMFQTATVGRTKNPETNEAIATGIIASARNAQDRAQFMRDYLTVNGHLDGADREWKRYSDANPIFDPASPTAPKLNQKRQSPQQFFSQKPAASAPQGGKRPGWTVLGPEQ